MKKLTHISERGKIKMVDVTGKKAVLRRAVARGRIRVKPATLKLIEAKGLAKGDVFNAARLAGIMGAKKASELIPLCHPLPLSLVKVELDLRPRENAIEIQAEVKTEAKTGVEMEALTAVAVAALAVYDMVKAVDRTMEIGEIRLVKKTKGSRK
jgi:cyclic pyranopterin phosphate synthase